MRLKFQGWANSRRLWLQRAAHGLPLSRTDLPPLHPKQPSNNFKILNDLNCYVLGLAWKEPGKVWIQTGCYTEYPGCVEHYKQEATTFPQVKFGYVVFTEAETAERLFRQGGVVVRRASGERIQVRSWRRWASSCHLWNFCQRCAWSGWMVCRHSFTAAEPSSGKLFVENSKLSKFCPKWFYIGILVGVFDM